MYHRQQETNFFPIPGYPIPGYPFPGYPNDPDESIERRLDRLERIQERHTMRLNRLNNRLRAVERRLNLSPYEY